MSFGAEVTTPLLIVFDRVRHELSLFFAATIENSFAGCGDNPRRA
jgi:hypothetical protein